jgi:chromosome partitioning protein
MSKRKKRSRAKVKVNHPSHTSGGRAVKLGTVVERRLVRTDLPQLDDDGGRVLPAPASVPAPGDAHGGRGFGTLAVIGHKGGSGKTTAAISIATGLIDRGARVLLVDTDPQGSTSAWSAAAAGSLRDSPTVISMGPGLQRPGQLARLAKAFDHVVVDCPPRGDAVVHDVLLAADLALLPCGPGAIDAWALADSVELVHAVQRSHPALRGRVLLTRKAAGTALAQNAREALDDCGLPLLSVTLGYRVAYQESMGYGRGVIQHEPRGTAAAEVRALVGELLALSR